MKLKPKTKIETNIYKKSEIELHEKMGKQEFNIIINTGNELLGNKGYIKYRKVSSVSKFTLFANVKYPEWKFATVYDKATRSKIEVIKP